MNERWKCLVQECRSFERWAWCISATSSSFLVWSSRWVFWPTNASILPGKASKMKLTTLIRCSQSTWAATLFLFPLTSMQQGKMFFFIGVIMASIQGGYARRIKPGQHIGAVRVVGASSSCISKISSIKQSPCWKHTMHYFTFVCVTIFLFLGNRVIDPSVCAHRALLECNDALRWPGVVLIWWAWTCDTRCV